MQPIECGLCGTTVLVEKYSPRHTSVQWLADTTTSCRRFADYGATAPNATQAHDATNMRCPALQSTIEQAVLDGRVGVTRRTEPVPWNITDGHGTTFESAAQHH